MNFTQIKRFGQIPIEQTGMFGALARGRGGVGGERDDGYMRGVLPFFQFGGGLLAGDARQVDVHQNQVGMFGERQFQPLFAIGRENERDVATMLDNYD